jgi:hypothetical protein
LVWSIPPNWLWGKQGKPLQDNSVSRVSIVS